MGKKAKITKLQYTIEALTDEIDNLNDIISMKQERIAELINQNDRLTLTYEPYRPPGDEYEGVSFYELVEENDSLTKNILDKLEVIEELGHRLYAFEAEVRQLKKDLNETKSDEKPKGFWKLLPFRGSTYD